MPLPSAQYGISYHVFRYHQRKAGWPANDGLPIDGYEYEVSTLTGKPTQEFFDRADIERFVVPYIKARQLPKNGTKRQSPRIHTEADGTRTFNYTAALDAFNRNHTLFNKLIEAGKLTPMERKSPLTGLPEIAFPESQIKTCQEEVGYNKRSRRQVDRTWYIDFKRAVNELPGITANMLRTLGERNRFLNEAGIPHLTISGKTWWCEDAIKRTRDAIISIQNEAPPEKWKVARELAKCEIDESHRQTLPNAIRNGGSQLDAIRHLLTNAQHEGTLIEGRDFWIPKLPVVMPNGQRQYPIYYDPETVIPWLRSEPLADTETPATQNKPADEFVPSDTQREILESLDGVAKTADELMDALDVSRHKLFGRRDGKGGLKELMSWGMIENVSGIRGYYRPDRPPSAH